MAFPGVAPTSDRGGTMNSTDGTNDITIQVEGLGIAWVDSPEAEAAERIRDAFAAGARRATVVLADDDTEGHGAGDVAVATVNIRLDEDDVEGHAIELRFRPRTTHSASAFGHSRP